MRRNLAILMSRSSWGAFREAPLSPARCYRGEAGARAYSLEHASSLGEVDDPGVGEAGEQVEQEPGLQVVEHDLAALHDERALLVEARVEVQNYARRQAGEKEGRVRRLRARRGLPMSSMKHTSMKVSTASRKPVGSLSKQMRKGITIDW